jgi:hypothetical protein
LAWVSIVAWPFSKTALAIVSPFAPACSVEPPVIASELLPSAELLPIRIVPAFSRVPPL